MPTFFWTDQAQATARVIQAHDPPVTACVRALIEMVEETPSAGFRLDELVAIERGFECDVAERMIALGIPLDAHVIFGTVDGPSSPPTTYGFLVHRPGSPHPGFDHSIIFIAAWRRGHMLY